MAGEPIGPSLEHTIDWTPYHSRQEAQLHLFTFADNARLEDNTGIVWSCPDASIMLRKPTRDADGFAYSLVVQWYPVTPPPPPPPAGAWKKIANFFTEAMELEGQAELQQAEAQRAYGQAVVQTMSEWFSNKDNAHTAGLVIDIIGLLAFACLFIPGVGEVEMAAAVSAGNVTAGLAGAGAMMGAWVDGRYLWLSYNGNGEAQKKQAAKDFENDPYTQSMSVAAALLALPDFIVGGIATVRDLRALPQEIDEQTKLATELRAQAAADEKIAAARGKTAEDLRSAKKDVLAKSTEQWQARYTARAEALATAAKAANDKALLKTNKLHAAMYASVSTFLATPAAEAYFIHDNINNNKRTVGSLLMPAHSTYKYNPHPGMFATRIGVGAHMRR
jgi:hypothetical protein